MKIALWQASTAGLWLCAFRPFFLITASHSLLAMAWWLGSLAGLLPLPELPGGPTLWHAHELLFGFAGASIAGFLLTAIVEFTGAPAVSRQRVQTLLLLWFGGRLSYLLSGVLGILPAAGFDITFLALLSASLAGPLWQQPSRRHLSFFYALSGLTGAQTGFYVALWRQIDAMPWLLLSIGLMMILIVIALSRISMRLVNDVLEGQGGMTAPYLARPPRRHLATWSIALFSLAEFLLPGHTSTGWLALAAAAALLNLLNDWHVGRALWQRWVMIPYLVYWLMAAGYALIGLGLLTNSNWNSAGHHLLVAGALALAILIVMSVAGRMHSGYGLDHRHWLRWAAASLIGAAMLRAAASIPALMANYGSLLHAAASLWLVAWGLYLAFSWRVLAGPRPDSGAGCDEPR